MSRSSADDKEQRQCREAFEKAGYWPNEVMWQAWKQAWTLGRESVTIELAPLPPHPFLQHEGMVDRPCVVCGKPADGHPHDFTILVGSTPSHVATTASDAFNAAIDFALDTCDSGDCRSFLDMWREGDWDGIALHFADFKGPLPCTPERLPAAPVVDDDQRSAKPLPADSSAASSPSAIGTSEWISITERLPDVKLGYEELVWVCWQGEKGKLRVSDLWYVNRPAGKEGEEHSWEIQNEDGDSMDCVGWHHVGCNHSYDEFFMPFDSPEKIVAWMPIPKPKPLSTTDGGAKP